MNRRDFIGRVAALPLAAKAFAEQQKAKRTDSDSPSSSKAEQTTPLNAPTSQPHLDRYHLTRNRVLKGSGPAYTQEFLLEDIHATKGRRFTNFSGDVSGRWIGALAASSAGFGDKFPALDDVVRQVAQLQQADGYFGKGFHYDHPDDDDLALLWGNGRLLVGLMEYHALKPDPEILSHARRLGDFLLRLEPRFNSQQMADEFGAAHFASSYICWTQQTEGLAALYRATQDTRYRDLCAEISQRIERRPADHVHGYLCSVRGTLDLYQATKDRAYLDRAVAAWNDVMQSGDVLITGGVPEAWSPNKRRTEGCAECDWLRLNLALYRTTGEMKYLDMAENIYFNEFSMNQFATGDFGHGVLNAEGTPGIVPVRAWWCCTLHGLRAFADVQDSVFRSAGSQIYYDLPIDGYLRRSDCQVRASSRLATHGSIEIHVVEAHGVQSLTVRKPSWARTVDLTKNGRSVPGLRVDSVRTGDRIEAKYTMSLRRERAGEDARLAKRSALHFGPWLLGSSSNGNPGYFNELHSENQLMLRSARRFDRKGASAFDVPVALTTIAYLPAEFPDQPARAQLCAVGEQTASEPGQWQTAFLIQSES